MNKAITVILLFLIIVPAACSKNKEPILKLGKNIDKIKSEVTQETDVFNRNDNFAYSLSYKQPFGVDAINLRLYKGKEYTDLLLKESFNIKLQPDSKIIGNSFPVSYIVNKYGSGNYTLLFIIKDVVIAKKPFFIQGHEQMLNDTAGTKAYNEIMPERPNKDTSLQPNVMVKDQKPGTPIMQKKIDKDTVQPEAVKRDQKPNTPIIQRKTDKDTVQPEAVKKDQKPDNLVIQKETGKNAVQPEPAGRVQKPPEEKTQKRPAVNILSPSEMMGND